MNKAIFNEYKIGDKNGEPTKLAKILNDSLITYSSFNKIDLIKRYQIW